MSGITAYRPIQPRSKQFSVVVPVLNNAAALQRCIDSFAAQGFPDAELIVIDGGSTDGTLEVIRANEAVISNWNSEPDDGIYQAFNRGIERSRGHWIYFLGSDDAFWSDDVLERVAEAIDQHHSQERIAYGKVAQISPGGDLIQFSGEPWAFYRRVPVNYWTVPHQSVFHHYTLFERHGLFDESYRLCGDFELLLRELKDHDPLHMPDIVVGGFSLGGVSTNPCNLDEIISERRRSLAQNGLPSDPVMPLSMRLKAPVYRVTCRLLGRSRTGALFEGVRRLRAAINGRK